MKKGRSAIPLRGYIALVSVIIISAVLIALVSRSGLEAYFARFSVTDEENRQMSQAAADACAWVALLAYAENGAYMLPEDGAPISIDASHSCIIDSIQKHGDDVVIHSYAHAGGSFGRTTVIVSTAPSIDVKNWEHD